MEAYCGIDWAEDHHDIALADQDGQLLARRRISDDAAGLATLLALLAEHGDTPEDPVPVAIETPRGLLVACLRATGRPVYPVNPMAVARYRDRHSAAGRKSDHGDAIVLANILRTDRHVHRPLPADTELAQAIAVLARAQQDAVWARTGAHNKLRSHLREYYPAFLAAFADARGGITRPQARAILAVAPAPAAGAALTLTQLRALLRKAGRRRSIDAEAARLRETLRAPQMRQLPLVEDAMGRQALALLRQLDAACAAADDLEQAVSSPRGVSIATGTGSSALSPCSVSKPSSKASPAASSLMRRRASSLPSRSARAMSWWSSAQSIPQNTSIRSPFCLSRAVRGLAARGHARSLMEGLAGTAIRSAVRDLSCPQGPGPG